MGLEAAGGAKTRLVVLVTLGTLVGGVYGFKLMNEVEYAYREAAFERYRQKVEAEERAAKEQKRA